MQTSFFRIHPTKKEDSHVPHTSSLIVPTSKQKKNSRRCSISDIGGQRSNHRPHTVAYAYNNKFNNTAVSSLDGFRQSSLLLSQELLNVQAETYDILEQYGSSSNKHRLSRNSKSNSSSLRKSFQNNEPSFLLPDVTTGLITGRNDSSSSLSPTKKKICWDSQDTNKNILRRNRPKTVSLFHTHSMHNLQHEKKGKTSEKKKKKNSIVDKLNTFVKTNWNKNESKQDFKHKFLQENKYKNLDFDFELERISTEKDVVFEVVDSSKKNKKKRLSQTNMSISTSHLKKQEEKLKNLQQIEESSRRNEELEEKEKELRLEFLERSQAATTIQIWVKSLLAKIHIVNDESEELRQQNTISFPHLPCVTTDIYQNALSTYQRDTSESILSSNENKQSHIALPSMISSNRSLRKLSSSSLTEKNEMIPEELPMSESIIQNNDNGDMIRDFFQTDEKRYRISLYDERKRIFTADGRPSSQLRTTILSSTLMNQNNDRAFHHSERSKLVTAPAITSMSCPIKHKTCSFRGEGERQHLRTASPEAMMRNSSPLESPTKGNTHELCFNCWSAGEGQKCVIHSSDEDNQNSFLPLNKENLSEGRNNGSSSILLCQNWDIGTLYRRYRSEDIQEIFMKKMPSLYYDSDRRQFHTIIGKKHPIYRYVSQHIAKHNLHYKRLSKVRMWFYSLINWLRTDRIVLPSKEAQKRVVAGANAIRLRNSIMNQAKVQRLMLSVSKHHPKAPITGTTLAEKTGKEKYLYERTIQNKDGSNKLIKKYIIDGPVRTPIAMLKPRKYELVEPTTILLDDYKHLSSENKSVSPTTISAKEEKGDISSKPQSLEFWNLCTGSQGLEYQNKTQKFQLPLPKTTKYITFGRKANQGNLAVGGLNAECILFQFVRTQIPPRFGNFCVMNKEQIDPERSPEVTTFYKTMQIKPIAQKFIHRPFINHPLDTRKPPTMTLIGGLDKNEKHFLGLNRPHQTNEEDDHGFRTSDYSPLTELDAKIDTNTFTPDYEVATFNEPREHKPITTRADSNYPFREPTAYTSTTMDFYEHLRTYGVCTLNKVQAFTTIGKQDCGKFMRGCDMSQPLGSFKSTTFRNWAFVQKSPIRDFLTKDGQRYWYNYNTGETFWERPFLTEEEKVSVREGGEIFHSEEDKIIRNNITSDYRFEQLKVRQMTLEKLESKDMKRKRIKSVSKSGATRPKHVVSETEMQDIDIKAVQAEASLPEVKELEEAQEEIKGSTSSVRDQISQRVKSTSQNVLLNSSDQMGGHITSDLEVTGSVQQEIFSTTEASPLPDGGNANDIKVKQVPHVQPPTVPDTVLDSIAQAVGGAMQVIPSTKDMIKLGMGIGMSLGAQGLLDKNLSTNSSIDSSPETSRSIEHVSLITSDFDKENDDKISLNTQPQISVEIPKLSMDNLNAKSDKEDYDKLDHTAEEKQRQRKELIIQEENDRQGFIGIQSSSQTKAEKAKFCFNNNVEKTLTQHPGPLKDNFNTHDGAGLGNTYIRSSESDSYNKIILTNKNLDNRIEVRRSADTLPVGFLSSIASKKVCKQYANYLDTSPSIPSCKTVGRVKPRGCGQDWLAIGFNPWSAGKESLSSEFIDDLGVKVEALQEMGPNTNNRKHASTNDEPFIQIVDKEGLAEQDEMQSIQNQNEITFSELCSHVRHGKYSEIKEKFESPDWSLPIDFVDESGNSLLHICCQNGNKRIAKLCLRKGSDINKQNNNGQTCLHYAFGYGFEELGDYLITKGADDSIVNIDGLTCYEGLTMEEVAAI